MSPRVRRVVSTRAGGRSRGDFASFNLSALVGDDPAAVVSRRLYVAFGAGAVQQLSRDLQRMGAV